MSIKRASELARKKHDVERRKEGQLYLGRKNAPLGLYVLSFVFLHGKSVWTPGWGGAPVQPYRHGTHDIYTHACKHTFTQVLGKKRKAAFNVTGFLWDI